MYFKKNIALLSLLLLGACGGGDHSDGIFTPTLSLPSNYSLKWSDDFSTTLGSAWTYDLGAPLYGNSVWGNNEREYYTSDPQNVFTSGGLLTIQPVAGVPAVQDAQGKNLLATSARIKTDTPAYYAALNPTPYGFYEVRAQIPCIAGAWPAVWMMGRSGAWPANGEIDIAEWFGALFSSVPNQMQSGVHTPNHYGANALYHKMNVDSLCTGFHSYQLHWTASALVMGVDGTVVFQYQKPSGAGAADWPFDQPAYLLLNVAVGGNLGGNVNLADIPNMKMVVDWVKVWQP
jgi:beta-glucanase (GH16 family)